LAKGKRQILGNKESKDFVGKYRVFKTMTFWRTRTIDLSLDN
jgi:hypothetical protein